MKKIFGIIFVSLALVLAGCGENQSKKHDGTEKFLGKPAVIIFAGTFCSHCVESMPEFETKIWDKYNKNVNIFVNVLDKKRFKQNRISQGFDAELDFEKITGQKCEYVPSWVILDKEGKVQNKSCGNEKGIKEIKITLKQLLK